MVYHRSKVSTGHDEMSSGLWIIVLEAGLALALFLGLVWWTLPKRTKREIQDGREDSPPR
jgi:hypothetical protein